MAHARKLAADAASRLDELSAQRAALEKRLAKLDDEAAELLRLARRKTIRQERLDASMAEVERDQQQVHDEIAAVEAQIALAEEDVPLAGDIAQVCRDLIEGAQCATAQEKRDRLDLLRVQVTMRGLDYEITGIVPELTMTGTLAVDSTRTADADSAPSSARVQGAIAQKSATKPVATRLLHWSWP